jgi:(1->4)-alpha-D-glucan 1-alpha-D-glucosylmutase
MPRPLPTDEVRRDERRDGYPPTTPDEAKERLRFAMKFQQYTSPVHAKGLEDTAFYRFNVLLSLNEVGGDPDRVGRTVEAFHEANARRLSERPHEMIATATHDTKLGEDTRARINAISELPDVWSREVGRWQRLNRNHKTLVDGEPAPDRNDEYRFYQALLGVWPVKVRLKPDTTSPGSVRLQPSSSVRLQPDVDDDFVERLRAFMIKSVKEAKLHTSWLTPHEEYEAAVASFVERTLKGPGAAKFLAAFEPFAAHVARAGFVNGLAQVVMKLGSPGVPDLYQGTDLWDYSLVDPDNRRPVDFEQRARALDEIESVLAEPVAARKSAVAALVESWSDGRIKLLVTTAGLRLRRDQPDLFLSGAYLPLVTQLTVPADIVAFARLGRNGDGRAALFIAPRLVAPLVSAPQSVPLGGDAWKTSRILLPPELASRTFTNVLTGERVEPTSTVDEAWLFAGQVFGSVPAAILAG